MSLASMLLPANIEYQVISVIAAFICCSLLGVERSIRHKDAGVKTHVLVGVGACIFTLVSTYGFSPVLATTDMHLDPSRIAAQVVSGIGFLGAGVIFVNNDTVRGLTTAATIWLSAAIGMACGAFMISLAIMAIVVHYLVVFLIGPFISHLVRQPARQLMTIEYTPSGDIMRKLVMEASKLGYANAIESTKRVRDSGHETMRVTMRFQGPGNQSDLAHAIAKIKGVEAVSLTEETNLD